MNVAVVGSRAFESYGFLREKMSDLRFIWGDFTVISGGAKGADALAVVWATEHGMPVPQVFLADWDVLSHPDARIKTRGDGKLYDALAGFRRNTLIVQAADVVVAFMDVNNPTPGTQDTIKKARQAGKPVYILWPGNEIVVDE